jgi:hypothetical protein
MIGKTDTGNLFGHEEVLSRPLLLPEGGDVVLRGNCLLDFFQARGRILDQGGAV